MAMNRIRRAHTLRALALLVVGSGRAFAQCETDHFEPPLFCTTSGFGGSLAVHGDIMVIGDIFCLGGKGVVYLFHLTDDGWTHQQTIDDQDVQFNGHFGYSCALDDNWLVVGAPDDDNGDEPEGTVFVFELNELGLAELTQTIRAEPSPEGLTGPDFGFRTAISDGWIAVTWYRYDGNRGRVNLYAYDGTEWQYRQGVQSPSATGSLAFFGQALAMDGARFVASTPGSDAVSVYQRRADEWLLEHEFLPDAAIGLSADICGDTLAFGLPTASPGEVFISNFDGTVWSEPITISTTMNDGIFPWFGATVALANNGSTLAVGAPFDQIDGFDSGAVHLFQRIGSRWAETAKLTPGDPSPGNRFGNPIALDGNTLLASGFEGPWAFTGALQIDRDADGVVDACEAILPDLDHDGAINASDLTLLLAAWGPCDADCPADFNQNGAVEFGDLLLLLEMWNPAAG